MNNFVDLDFIPESAESKIRNEGLESEIQQKFEMDNYFVPTNSDEIKFILRRYDQPITFFGEREEDRRERLRKFLFENKINLVNERENEFQDSVNEEAEEKKSKEEIKEEVFYTKGPSLLKDRREEIFKFSILRSHERITKQNKMKETFRNHLKQNDLLETSDPKRQQQPKASFSSSDSTFNIDHSLKRFLKEEILRSVNFFHQMNDVDLSMSIIADKRPSQAISISNDRSHVLTGSWSGLIKLWSMEGNSSTNIQRKKMFRAHQDRVISVCLNPSLKSFDGDSFGFVSSSADRTVKFWNLKKRKPIKVFKDHSFHRLGNVKVHPSGRFVGSCSFDGVWHFYDVEKCSILFEQEGHSSEVYDLAFHPDGSLVCTCDYGGILRLWDLRTGKSVVSLRGHCRKCLSVDFSPDGFHLASAGDDNSIRIWNLRKMNFINNVSDQTLSMSEYILPAHPKLISCVRYEKEFGRYLTSCSFDGTIRIWRNREFSLIKTLKGHDGMVMGMDIATHSSKAICDPLIVSTSYDRTWKIWKRK